MAGKAYQPSERAVERLREFGDILRAGRIRRNLTQADLANRVGVSRKTLERLEDGNPGAAWGLAIDVCLTLGLPSDPDCLSDQERQTLLDLLDTRQRVRAVD